MQRTIEAQTDTPLSDFCGLSPYQMGQLLYAALDGDVAHFNPRPLSLPDCRALHLFKALLLALADNPAKATATGCLPLKLCKTLAAEYGDDVVAGGVLGGIRSESDFFELQGIRVAASYCGLQRFAGFFGLAHIEVDQSYPQRTLTVRKTAWLDDFVSFRI
jgi:hypothetical protein